MKKPLKSFTVKISKWRCGGPDGSYPDSLVHTKKSAKATKGYGDTALLNNHGFKCCLGFAVKASGYRPSICNLSAPHSLKSVIPGLSELDTNGEIIHSRFSERAIMINDNRKTSIEEKIKRLTALGKRYDIEINFIP